jgi:protein involved in polysaccharide export with SLBB domain
MLAIAIRTAVAASMLFHAAVFAQESIRRDPGIAVNYAPLKWFATNYPQQTMHFMRLPGISGDYSLGTGDVITVDIVGAASLRHTARVDGSGEIALPVIGSVRAGGLTALELEAVLKDRLKTLDLVREPEVLVYIDAYEAKRIYVVGEVDNPGEYVMTQDLTLLDAIFIAGGLDFSADRYGYLHRRTSEGELLAPADYGEPGSRTKPVFNTLAKSGWTPAGVLSPPGVAAPGTEVITVDLEPLKSGGILKDNIKMRHGDVFVVPRRNVQSVHVIGGVRLPGSFELPPPVERTLLVSQAIAWAGGPTPAAKLKNGTLVRYLENGRREEHKVDFAAILTGKQADIPVLPDDIIFIPNSSTKSLAYGLVTAVPGMAQGAILFRGLR